MQEKELNFKSEQGGYYEFRKGFRENNFFK